jgi:undecaprenyl pyrophosphate phosphatase UppP
MSRWDETNFDNDEYEEAIDHEEAKLLKKFDDYRDLEKRELEKRNHQNNTQKEKGVSWNDHFLFSTIIQAVCIVGITASLIFFELINSKIMNLVLVAALAVLAGEIVIISIFLRKKSSLKDQKLTKPKTKSEFDFI